MQTVNVAIIGLGTVGTGVARLLLDHADRLNARTGKRLVLRRVVVRDRAKARNVPVPADRITTDPHQVVDDPHVQIAVELIGGTTDAREITLRLLRAGKDVVTANKALLAEHGPELFACARASGRVIAFEASVGGGIPIIRALSESFIANQVEAIAAILNGTSNHILTQMAEAGQDYAEALRQAQDLGYAEADPTLDVDGSDAAHKLAILALLAFGVRVRPDQIPRRGIDHLHLADLRYAAELGYVIKLLATAHYGTGTLELNVGPTLVHRQRPLAQVRGAYNAIRVMCDAAGDTLFSGRGAGQMPTASSVVADVMDVAIGRAALTFQTLRLGSREAQAPVPLRLPDAIQSRYYLRFTAEDRPGVLAQVARVLGQHNISIASMIQHEADEDTEGKLVPMVLMTHVATEQNLCDAIAEIDRLATIRASTVWLRVES